VTSARPISGLRVRMLLDNAFAPDWRVEREATALTQNGACVRVLCWDRGGKLPQREERDGVFVERIVTPSSRDIGMRQLATLQAFYRRAWSTLGNESIDVVHAHDLLMLPLAAGIAKRARARLIYDAHEIYHLMEARKYPGFVRWVIDVTERSLLQAYVDLLITVSEQRVREYWSDAARSTPIAVVGNWYDPIDVSLEDRTSARITLGVPQSALCIVYAGGLSHRRRVDLLWEAAALRADVFFVVAGRGSPNIELKLAQASQALPNLRYMGWVEHPDTLYSAADALYYVLDPCHPYSRFAASNTLYLAIARCLPLITSSVGEPGLIMKEIAPALVLERAETDALLLAISFIEAPANRLRTAERIRGWQSRFNWQLARRALLEAYGSVLETGHA